MKRFVIPAKAGIQLLLARVWTPAFAGVTAMALMLFLPCTIQAADPLAQWAHTIEDPIVQKDILNRIFPGAIGTAAVQEPQSTMYLFSKSGSWVRLGHDVAYLPPAPGGGSGQLIVSCMMYRRPERDAVSAVSYLFRDANSKPIAISSGYASHERVQKVELPKLNKTLVLLLDSASQRSGSHREWNAFLLDVAAGDRPKTVWKSPNNARQFQFGFDTLGGEKEELVFRSLPGGSAAQGDMAYSAYRWNDDRFEPDSFAYESKLKKLPQDVWQYGTGL